jgi:small subunit ribosomal protein S6
MINRYELLYLVSGNYTDEEIEPIKAKVRELIEKAEGKILLEDTLGKRKLAYPINNQHSGSYLLCEFELEGINLKKLDTDMKLTTELLRHTVVKREPNAPTFRQLTQQQQAREREQAARQQRTTADAAVAAEEAKPKMTGEQLDEKLDEILQGDII